jgi:hypothetical protein
MDTILDQYEENPRKEYGMAIDVGTNDPSPDISPISVKS